jgi:hypothetical protein
MRLNRLLLAFALSVPCVSSFINDAEAELAVVVHPSNPTTELSKSRVSALFLGKYGSFPEGGKAVPIDHPEGAEIRDTFYDLVANKNASQLKAYWAKLIFTGKGNPPKEYEGGDSEIKKMIAEDAEARMIGYIDSTSVDSSVKVVFTIQ